MKEFWLILYPDTFIWIKGNNGIVYNSKNYKSFLFSIRGKLEELSKTLIEPDHLYGVLLLEEELNEPEVAEFIENVKEIQAGCFLEKKPDVPRPVSYPPILKIQEDIKALRLKHQSGSQTNEILRNLTEITIHFNGDPNYNPLYYKQFTALSDSDKTLSVNAIKQFTDKCCKEYLVSLNLVGDFSSYPEREALFQWINTSGLNRYHLITNLKSWLSHVSTPECSGTTTEIRQTVIIEEINALESTDLSAYLPRNIPVTFCFPVDSEQTYHLATETIRKKELQRFEIVPVFNGKNLGFFRNYVYTTPDDLRFPSFNRREVFSNQVINNFFFGKLIILPDKKVYSNVNEEPLGTLNDSIYRLLFKELDKGTSWRMIRDQKPCTECLYQWLCPSPSNYELLIGKPNLCKIVPD